MLRRTESRPVPDIERGMIAAEGEERVAQFVTVAARLEALQQALPADHFTLEWALASLGPRSSGLIILVLALLAAAPGVSLPAGLLLLVPAAQMLTGRSRPYFPAWIAARPLPSRSFGAILLRAIPALKLIERIVRRRGPAVGPAGQRALGLVILSLTIRLLTNPLPFSNVVPALVIAMIALAEIEEDGLLLSIALALAVLTLSADIALLWEVAARVAGLA